MISDAIADTKLDFAHFAWSHAPAGDYGTWAEDSGNEFTANGVVVEKATNGFIDYFTRDATGKPRTTIEASLDKFGIVYHLDAVLYENDTGYIHYSWEYFEHG